MVTTNYDIDHNRLMGDLLTAINTDMARLSVEANGGRSILFVFPPADEERYIAEARQKLSGFTMIDLRQLFTQFIDSMGIGEFQESYADFGNELFASHNFSDGTFIQVILDEIKRAFDAKLIPVLIHTGTIYGMGFSNVNIMEQDFVMHSPIPLVVFYPATIDGDNIMFLGKQVASHYRCAVIK